MFAVVITGWVNGTGKDILPKLTILDIIGQRRALPPGIYEAFLDAGGPAFTGQIKWKNSHLHQPLLEFLSVPDEAFLLLIVDNYWQKWMHVWEDQVSAIDSQQCMVIVHANKAYHLLLHYSQPGPPPTLPYIARDAGTNRVGNSGWTTDGLDKYTSYAHAIQQEQQDGGATFDAQFMEFAKQHLPIRAPKHPHDKAFHPNTVYNGLVH